MNFMLIFLHAACATQRTSFLAARNLATDFRDNRIQNWILVGLFLVSFRQLQLHRRDFGQELQDEFTKLSLGFDDGIADILSLRFRKFSLQNYL